MKSLFTSLACVLSLLPVMAVPAALAEHGKPIHFDGLVNDYTPTNVSGGPYEMHGQWSMDVHEWGAADFILDMTMSDYGMTPAGAVDPGQGGQMPHTHHIALTNQTITWNMDNCPVVSPPTTEGFQINGTVSLMTGNGGPAPFETTPPSSTLQVCIMGGVNVQASNMSMVFGGPATKHFGPQGIHGVIQKALPGEGRH